MKIRPLITASLAISLFSYNANAESCLEEVDCSTVSITASAGSATNCGAYTTTCYKGGGTGNNYYKITTCHACNNFYDLKQSTSNTVCSNKTFQYCTCDCSKANTYWSNHTTGYSKAPTCTTCDCSTTTRTCTGPLQYRCSSGYYGTANSTGTSGCTKCPAAADGITVRSTPGNGTTLQDCYIAQNTSFSDSTGSGIYADNCYYE